MLCAMWFQPTRSSTTCWRPHPGPLGSTSLSMRSSPRLVRRPRRCINPSDRRRTSCCKLASRCRSFTWHQLGRS
ncbi:unnamed protein product [Symbiodinium necroappetens]|uniref:Uncharacterized protein n=1 Tax=Symbiodinium necroappetens TaxID=1628268 RepID=A0A812J490_9DINO|nr:unnamed protein product [Symbiodinium necroappetens]